MKPHFLLKLRRRPQVAAKMNYSFIPYFVHFQEFHESKDTKDPGPSGWWGAYSSVDALFSQLSILFPHLFEDYFPLCPSPISHFSLAIQKEFIRLLLLHPGHSQHHYPLPLFPIFDLLSTWSAFQLKQLKNTHPSPPTFSISMEFLALILYFKPLLTHSDLFHHISFPLPLR